MNISKYFELNRDQHELDFIDIDPEDEMKLFIDPYNIRNLDTPFGRNLNTHIRSFWDHSMRLLKQKKDNDVRRLFKNLKEPNETCLGNSLGKPKGRSIGRYDTEVILASIKDSSAFELGVLERVEDLKVFVPNIGEDKISDIVTNIIRGPLIKYTQNQCKIWEIPLRTSVVSGAVWNLEKNEWEQFYTDMLVINDQKILLVPKSIVSIFSKYSAQGFKNDYVLKYLQGEHLEKDTRLVQRQVLKNGTIKRIVTKKSIEEDSKIDKDYLARFAAKYPDIFLEFNSKTKKKTLSNDEISNVDLNSLVQKLKSQFSKIKPGINGANDYQKLIMATLEFLCYPSLINPILEERIHNGKKRIDITFDNNAEKGFFFRLPNTYDVASTLIVVECKNYNQDVANPELDQIAGRFSPNRGKFGLLLCRNLENEELFLERCSETFRDQRGVIIPLTDDDLLICLNEYLSFDSEDSAFEKILSQKFRKILS